MKSIKPEIETVVKELLSSVQVIEDNRPQCPAVDGKIPSSRLVDRLTVKGDSVGVELLPNCKGPCIESGNGLHFQLNERREARLCPCGQANQRLHAIEAMKLPQEAVKMTHVNYDWSVERGLKEKILHFLEAVNRGERKALIMYGGSGKGKTHALLATAHLAALSGPTPKRINYLSQPHYLEAVKAGWDDPAKRVARVTGARALFIDELGYGRQTEWERTEMNQVIHHAWQGGMSIVIASDQRWEVLGRFLDDRIKDRLIQGTEKKKLVHEFTGPSRRSEGCQW